jgi:hypothetical protein
LGRWTVARSASQTVKNSYIALLFVKLLHEWAHYLYHVHALNGNVAGHTPVKGIFKGESGHAFEKFAFGYYIGAFGPKAPAYDVQTLAYGATIGQPEHAVPGNWINNLVSEAYWTSGIITAQSLKIKGVPLSSFQSLISQHFLSASTVKKALGDVVAVRKAGAPPVRFSTPRQAKRKMEDKSYEQTEIPFKKRKLIHTRTLAAPKFKTEGPFAGMVFKFGTPAEIAAGNQRRRSGIKV